MVVCFGVGYDALTRKTFCHHMSTCGGTGPRERGKRHLGCLGWGYSLRTRMCRADVKLGTRWTRLASFRDCVVANSFLQNVLHSEKRYGGRKDGRNVVVHRNSMRMGHKLCCRSMFEGQMCALSEGTREKALSRSRSYKRQSRCKAGSSQGGDVQGDQERSKADKKQPTSLMVPQEGPSADIGIIFSRLKVLALPYWIEGEQAKGARWRLAGVLALTLGTTGVSVVFNFLGRDFFNALSAKDQAKFTEMLFKWLIALSAGIPVFVLRDYYLSRLALDWRAWMTKKFTDEYFAERTFYRLQSEALLDNPDQRIAVDVRSFTDTSLEFGVTMLNAFVDLISFSGILFSIYPPLFVALLVYSVGGTVASVAIGRPLVGLNFGQEAAEADFRYGLVRVRENAESIAFYGGEGSEARLLNGRLQAAIDNFQNLLLASRNLNFFTSFYRFLIQILPAAVVAPLYFQGKIEFGVINQSVSAFNHILSDVSLVIYQFEAIAGFSAVVDRLGELEEVFQSCREKEENSMAVSSGARNDDASKKEREIPSVSSEAVKNDRMDSTVQSKDIKFDNEDGNIKEEYISVIQVSPPPILRRPMALNTPEGQLKMGGDCAILEIDQLCLRVPHSGRELIRDLSLDVRSDHSLLVMGPSGTGKTSLLRAIAGLWRNGSGNIILHGAPAGHVDGSGEIFFIPQRPYVVLGTLRDQLLYPTWKEELNSEAITEVSGEKFETGTDHDETLGIEQLPAEPQTQKHSSPPPSDKEMKDALERVQLGDLLSRLGNDLDSKADWAGMLSLGEQQRLAFARVLLSRPLLVLMDESTSALDTKNERLLYQSLKEAGVTFVSVGHRPTLLKFHENLLVLNGDGAGGWELKKCKEVSLDKVIEMMD